MAPRSRRPARAPRPAPPAVGASSPCPCDPAATYAACCGRFHAGTGVPATAELLMRSRYSAFAVRDEAYLLRTWAAGTRPDRLGLDPATRWNGLTILDTKDGSAFHTTGSVTFLARYTDRANDPDGGAPGVLRERSTFAREDGRWVYVDGALQGAED
ncbi:YchJ family protein [Streptomyces sp. NBC_01497]|uniref:YchJ family protein n=1 Tax=Streptomyces sp. NBC_01497 TaxID=2903885 RepID=UPI002E3064E9|nr:YchJ family protein [Streptomyces sp. NBC_01497]